MSCVLTGTLSATAVVPVCLSPDAVCPPAVAASFVSSQGSATLVGYSEITSPSVPPKKYRKYQAAGYSYSRGYGTTICLSGVSFGYQDMGLIPSGYSSYDRLTGVLTNAQLNFGANVDNTCGRIGSLIAAGFLSPPIINYGDPSFTEVLTQTTATYSIPGGNCNCVITGGSTSIKRSAAIVATISDEDTEADAFVRSVKTTGTSNIAVHNSRGAGVFTVVIKMVSVSMACTSLSVGRTYRITLPIVTADIGGANPVASNVTYDFTPTSSSQTVTDLYDAASAKQITIGTPTIAAL